MNDFATMPYRILDAQRTNLKRLEEGEIGGIDVLDPIPDLIRLDDTPLRVMSDAAQRQKQVIFTLAMLKDAGEGGRIVGRDERNVTYGIHCAVRLTEGELKEDREQDESNLLARKLDACLFNIKLAFNDDPHLLKTSGCAAGLVDHSRIADVLWDRSIQYPTGGFVCVCTGQTYDR